MNVTDFQMLTSGDLVRSKLSNECYLVTGGNYGGDPHGRVTASRTVDMTNPSEWELVSRAGHKDAGGS